MNILFSMIDIPFYCIGFLGVYYFLSPIEQEDQDNLRGVDAQSF